MYAIRVENTGQQPRLIWRETEDVTYENDEVLIDIKATAVNRADLSQARGNYPPPPGVTDILGLEMAGTIIELGSNVANWQAGDRVCALLSGGGYAEKVAVNSQLLLRLPDEFSFQEGAAIPEVWLTAYVNLFREGRLKPGRFVLIHAGGSGVGTAAVQLATLAGAKAIVTAGTEEKLTACLELGAVGAINYKTQDFEPIVMRITDGSGPDLILDPVGAAYFAKNLRILKPGGRLVQIGLLSGSKETIDLGLVLGKSLKIVGSRLRPRPLDEKIDITDGFRREYWEEFTNGQLRPVIDKEFPIEKAQDAHNYVSENRNIGKVILSVG